MIDDKGTQVGVLSRDEALAKAKELGVDLVLVAPKANPPVAKIIEFSKFKYQQEKKEQASKKKTSPQEVKELRLTPFMAENDRHVRLERARDFLKNGDKVRLTVWFKGRQITKKQFGYDILKAAVTGLQDVGAPEQEPRFRGRNLEILIKPIKKHETSQTKNQVKS